jgi:hypothetical protein
METALRSDDTIATSLALPETRSFFQSLGAEIDAAWRAVDYDETSFPSIATEALERRPPSDNVDPYGAAEWVLRTPVLPRQRLMGDTEFGEPPIHVFDTPKFFIQILYWLDGTTSIHQHGFSGAFHVLAGSSLHSQFEFETTRRINAHLRIGDIRLQSAEILKPGTTQSIFAGGSMIHSLFHLERPSVTVVVRTPSEAESGPQYDYLRPSLALDPFYVPELLKRRAQSLTLYARVAHPDFLPLLGDTLARADAFELVYLARAICPYLTLDQARAAVETARPRHPMLVDVLKQVVGDIIRQRMIIGLRRKLRDPNHRLFLALLMSFRSAEELFAVVKAEYPYREPEDVVLDWMADLSTVVDPENRSRKVFAMELDASALAAIRLMFGGRTVDDVLGTDTEGLSDDEVLNLRESMSQLLVSLRSSVFATLFH